MLYGLKERYVLFNIPELCKINEKGTFFVLDIV
jgi:hypothetical protein